MSSSAKLSVDEVLEFLQVELIPSSVQPRSPSTLADHSSVNLPHDATLTICCVTELVVGVRTHTHIGVTGSVDRKLCYDNDMY